MKKEYLKDGKLNPETLAETGAPAAYGLNTIEEFLLACGIEVNIIY